MREGISSLVPWKGSVDDGLQAPIVEATRQLVVEAVDRVGLLFDRPGSQRRAKDGAALRHQVAQHHLGLLTGADADDLSEFGYDQQLHRSLGKFASFAAGFSFVSILTTIFQLFGLGFGFIQG